MRGLIILKADVLEELVMVQSDDNAEPALQHASTRTGVWQPSSCPGALPHHYKEFRKRLQPLAGASGSALHQILSWLELYQAFPVPATG